MNLAFPFLVGTTESIVRSALLSAISLETYPVACDRAGSASLEVYGLTADGEEMELGVPPSHNDLVKRIAPDRKASI
jgi:hypothetical protein